MRNRIIDKENVTGDDWLEGRRTKMETIEPAGNYLIGGTGTRRGSTWRKVNMDGMGR